MPDLLNAASLWYKDKQDSCACCLGPVARYFIISIKVWWGLDSNPWEGSQSSLEKLGQKRGCFMRKKVVNDTKRWGLLRSEFWAPRHIMSKWKVVASGPERGGVSRWDWRRSSVVRFYNTGRRKGKGFSSGPFLPWRKPSSWPESYCMSRLECKEPWEINNLSFL